MKATPRLYPKFADATEQVSTEQQVSTRETLLPGNNDAAPLTALLRVSPRTISKTFMQQLHNQSR